MTSPDEIAGTVLGQVGVDVEDAVREEEVGVRMAMVDDFVEIGVRSDAL